MPGDDEPWSDVRVPPLALALQATTVAALVGGTAAFVALDKQVSLSVDGHTRQVRTFGSTVADVLARSGVQVGPHDTVAPAPDTRLTDGALVAVRTGRLLTLTVDGVPRQVWVTAQNVDEALAQLGLRAEGAYLSASRSRAIPRDGLLLELRLPKQVTVVADGQQRSLVTTAATVGGALAEAGVALGGDDRTDVPVGADLRDGMTITVTRISGTTSSAEAPVPFATVTRDDPGLPQGQRQVVQRGQQGRKVQTFRDLFVDGKLTERVLLAESVTQPPVDQVVAVGSGAPAPAPAAAADGLNWAALARCESGGNPRAVNGAGYYGLYQFSLSTWRSVGGTGNPIDASPAEQTARAQALYARSGRSPWPVCGRLL
ncbi:MAG: ubiquitin-like domain-containing protein [Actinomycetota bacterium]